MTQPHEDLDRIVNVPGQYRWHTHTCKQCGTSWTHIAPIPMTQRQNIAIHTCHKCGSMAWGFEPYVPPWALAGLGIMIGVILVCALTRKVTIPLT